ncbi:MAG: S8 family serine peptidase [Planctomycetota bacterium]
MAHLLPTLSVTLLSCLMSTAAAQTPTQPLPDKLHPHLRTELRNAAPEGLIPVYFVVGDAARSAADRPDWWSQVQGQRLGERRTHVMNALRRRADRLQAPLMAELRRQRDQGLVTDLRPLWLADVVCCRATPAAVRAAATVDGVREVWADATWPRARVEDDAARTPSPRRTEPPGALTAGIGPRETRADLVWALGIRGQGIVIANADSGINLQHQDLIDRLWTNAGEIPGNGLDDDGNGFVDDVHGFAFDPFGGSPVLEDFGGHGTNTAGCLVADGTCSGTIDGQAPGAQVMTCRLNYGESAQWASLQYALQMGADLHTSSHSYKIYFTPPPNYRIHRQVADRTWAAGLIRTNSTSNDGATCTGPGIEARPFNISAPGNVPPPYLDPRQRERGTRSGVLGVGAYDAIGGRLEPYSPCGPAAWSLADLRTALPTYSAEQWDPAHNDYPYDQGQRGALLKPDLVGPDNVMAPAAGACSEIVFAGTSAATPSVAGVLALWKSANPSLGPEDVAMIAHQTARDVDDVPGKSNGMGAGKIDALRGLERALCVHRVNGDPAWDAVTQSGVALELAIDGSPGAPAAILLGGGRAALPMGPGGIGLEVPVAVLWSGTTDARGDARVALATPPGVAWGGFTQAVLDDRAGVTGRLLSSNVIGVEIVR